MRIAIVNDTKMALEGLKRIVAASPENEIAWLARDGVEAVDLCLQDTPDLILMDLIMPNMDGVEATRKIMKQSPCAILVVTSSVTGNTSQVFEAMGAGAIDAVNTPVISTDSNMGDSQSLIKKITTISTLIRNDVIPAAENSISTPSSLGTNKHMLIAFGASTGGPKALAQILKNIPMDISASIVIIQHVDSQFSHSFVEWLDKQIALPVRLAQHNESLKPATVYVSNSDKHLIINATGKFLYVNEPNNYPYRPSINVFFSSIAKNWKGTAIGILLTGMGKDGATGLLDMQTMGFSTIAQNKVSCAVYGMPKAAVDLNAADSTLHLSMIAPQIMQLVSSLHATPKRVST